MQQQSNRFRLFTISGAAALLLASGSVIAQDGPRRGQNDALRGPTVQDRDMPREERFGDSMMQQRRGMGDMANYRIMVASIQSLSDHENQRLRLTDEQTEKLTEIQSAYQKALRDYMAESREQSQNLRERVQKARENAGDDREAMQQIMERARARAQEIREGAPKSARAEAAMWEVLTPPQRRVVTAEVERRTQEMTEQRQMQRRDRDGAQPQGDRPAPREGMRDQQQRGERAQRGPAAERPDAPDQSTRRWAQLFQRIQKLSPEQQDRLFNMINQTLERAAASESDRPSRRGPGAGSDSPRPTDTRPERPRRNPGAGAGPRS